MAMNRLLEGHSRFREQVYPRHRELFEKLALGQRPDALFITCADSRIDPCLLTQTHPGELFICRAVGNIVPAWPNMAGGVSASIEYAAAVLDVSDIVVCGHTDCGVMKGVMNPEVLASLATVSQWLFQAQPARYAAETQYTGLSPHEFLLKLTERNVVEQLRNLRTHPSVARRLASGDLNLHGWIYHIAEGLLTEYNAATDSFAPVEHRVRETVAHG